MEIHKETTTEHKTKSLSSGAKKMLYFISASKFLGLVLLAITAIKEGFISASAASSITVFAVLLGLGVAAQTIAAVANNAKAALFFAWAMFIFDCVIFLLFSTASLLSITSEDKNFTLLAILILLIVTIFQLITVASIAQSNRTSRHDLAQANLTSG